MKYFLIVRQQNNQLGDMLCSVPMYKAIKKKYPDSHITLVTAPTNYNIPVKLINPYIDDILIFKKDSMRGYIEFIRNIRKVKYDFGIIPSTLNISRTSNIVNFISGAKTRVGVKRIDEEINPYHFLLNIKKEFDWNKNKVHQIYRVIDIVKQIGCDLDKQEIEDINVDITEDDIRFADEFVGINFPDPDKKLIGFHPGAGKIANRWDVKNFSGLIKMLHNRFESNILITSGNIDKEITNKLIVHLNDSGITPIVADNLEIGKLTAVLKKLNLYITNDTGLMHLAGFSGINTISLFGPTKGFEWAPLKKNQFYIQSKSNDINDITVKDVFDLSVNNYDLE
jgi:heptosyltransferase-2